MMQTKAAAGIYHYWDDLRGRKRVPGRVDIEPGRIRHILPDLFILEKNPSGDIRFRLAGTRICSLFARELRGSRFDSVWKAEQTNRLTRLAGDVMAQRLPMFVSANALTLRPEPIRTEIVLLPLRSPDGAVDRVIGAIAPFTRPISLDLHPVNFLELVTVQALDGTFRPDRPVSAPLTPVTAATGAATDESMGQTIRRVLHLRVLQGGKSQL